MNGLVWLLCAAAVAMMPGWGASARAAEQLRPSLEVFAGSASKPAALEIARAYEERTGTRVHFHFGGSGAVLAQMELARRGDVYFPGSPDFMEVAKRKGLVDAATEVRVVYLVPALSVARGNPKGIRRIEDLARPGVRVGMARPDTVCVGLYGVELLERQGLGAAVRRNVVNYAESCERTAQMLSLGVVDAVLGWDVFDDWDPQGIETIAYPPARIPRIGYVPAAVAVSAADPEAARAFLSFLRSEAARTIFQRHGYLTTLAAARALAGPEASVGGEFQLPAGWP